MELKISSDIWQAFPGMLLVVTAGTGLNNLAANDKVEAKLNYEITKLQSNWNFINAQSHPYINAWRKALKKVGISSDHPCAIENLVRRVIKAQGLRRINPLVDLYNAISLRHISPVGGIDIRNAPSVSLRFTKEGESFTELGSNQAVLTKANEICYADEQALLSRHFVWRQAEQGKIDQESSNFLLISEVLPELGISIAKEIQNSFKTDLQECFGVNTVSEILSEGTECWRPW